METLLAIGTLNSFFFALFVQTKKRANRGDRLLSILFLLLGSSFGMTYLSYLWDFELLQLAIWNISMVIAPVFYLYASLLINKLRIIGKNDLVHFIPYGLSIIYLVLVFLFYNETEIDHLFNSPIMKANWLYIIFSLVELIIIPFYVFLTFALLRKHNKNIKVFFSNIDEIDLAWLRALIVGVLLIWVVANGIYFMFPSDVGAKYGLGATSLFIFYLGYFAIRQKPIYPIDESPSAREVKYEKSAIKEGDLDILHDTLIVFMDKEKPYLDSDLSLNTLAFSLNISTHSLSQLINNRFEMNFYELINKYRVEEFIKKIKDGEAEKFTLMAIAYDCGFNSKSTFNRVFKKTIGRTPSAFVQETTQK